MEEGRGRRIGRRREKVKRYIKKGRDRRSEEVRNWRKVRRREGRQEEEVVRKGEAGQRRRWRRR